MHDATDQLPDSRQLIAWADLTAQLWRNGGGVTRQILSRRLDRSGAWVPTASDDWDWRLSIADVGSAGAFSSFTGMTRTLTVIEGSSVTLIVDGVAEELEKHRPFRFDGGADTSAELPHGPIRDLNLIARTGVVDAQVAVQKLSTGRPHRVSRGQYCVLLDGRARLGPSVEGETAVNLELFDTVLGVDTHPSTISGEGILAVITVSASA